MTLKQTLLPASNPRSVKGLITNELNCVGDDGGGEDSGDDEDVLGKISVVDELLPPPQPNRYKQKSHADDKQFNSTFHYPTPGKLLFTLRAISIHFQCKFL